MKTQEQEQRRFNNLHEHAFTSIMLTNNWLVHLQTQVFKPNGILPQHYYVLRVLKDACPRALSAGEIKAALPDKSPDLTRLLDKLEAKGYITRKLSQHNRRKMDIKITGTGSRLLRKMEPMLEKRTSEVAERISPREASALCEILEKLRS